jgi:hypothetical protein
MLIRDRFEPQVVQKKTVGDYKDGTVPRMWEVVDLVE